MQFAGKAAIVTGGAKGLGKSFAAALAGRGCAVLIADVDGSELAKTRQEIVAAGGTCMCGKVDVTRSADTAAMVEQVLAAYGRLDILINNAGGSMGVPKVPVDEILEEDWDRVVNLNLKGTFLCTKAAVPVMKKQKSGKIVNLSSITARIGGELTPVQYVCSKGAISTLTRHVAQELGPFGINVNAIAPGITLTQRLEGMWTQRKTEEERNTYLARIPLGRLGTVDEITKAVVFLCSSDADYITGITLDVNGGMFSV
ncbi:MAG: 3-oxoacyl-(acyl-carrier-protein) reductase FabG [Syntrophaceae bacterium PtaU1.Bin231]|nr:MAG: 3-oxoacyl-(acyl-carrier-protein) reductase FabG [Syntrophaceae bacterium PtaU1.Bin231]